MKQVFDEFLARKKAQKLRTASALPIEAVARLKDELAAMGGSAVVPLAECLSHGEARAHASEVLERLLDDTTVERFLGLLSSQNPAISSSMTKLLSTSRTYDARRLLYALSAEQVSRIALEPILREQARRLPAGDLCSLLPSLPRDGQAALLRAIELSQDPNTPAALLPLLRSTDPWIRSSVTKLLAQRPEQAAVSVQPIAFLLRDESKQVRFDAVQALHQLRAKTAVPAVISSLLDGDLKVQSAAIDALKDIGDATTVPQLLEVLTHDSEQARRGAVEVLNAVATPAAVQDLVRALRDCDWWVRVRAADALGTLGGPTVVQAVLGLMEDEDESIRRHAVEILNAVPDVAAVPALVRALGDPDWWVRERAIDALGRIGDERAVEPLLALFGEEGPVVPLAVRALGSIGDARALRPIAALLESEETEIKREAMSALSKFNPDALDENDRALLGRVLKRKRGDHTPTPGSGDVPMRVRGRDGSSAAGLNPFTISTPANLPSHTPSPSSLTPPAPSEGELVGAGASRPATVTAFNFAELEPGQVLLDRYEIVRRIGRGGYGTVYLVKDTAVDEELILKILSPQLAFDEVAAQRFVQELKLTRRIAHKNVIRIHDFLDLGGARAISMEYFPGRDLKKVLRDDGTLTPRRGLKIAAKICDGLAAAHAAGVIHRDIKPGNILVDGNDDVKLVDFGLASAGQRVQQGERLTHSGLLIGTPEYMAPEQITGDAVDPRVDLYSLGVVLYEAFSGVRPFTAETPVKVLFQHLEGEAPPPSAHTKQIPPEIDALVMSAMARDLDRRPASAAAFAADIRRVEASFGTAA